jgi:hypothetical protein
MDDYTYTQKFDQNTGHRPLIPEIQHDKKSSFLLYFLPKSYRITYLDVIHPNLVIKFWYRHCTRKIYQNIEFLINSQGVSGQKKSYLQEPDSSGAHIIINGTSKLAFIHHPITLLYNGIIVFFRLQKSFLALLDWYKIVVFFTWTNFYAPHFVELIEIYHNMSLRSILDLKKYNFWGKYFFPILIGFDDRRILSYMTDKT